MIAPRSSSIAPDTPRLYPGDHLSAEEFCRRWVATADLEHAELLDGRVYIPHPFSAGVQGTAHPQILFWLGHYATATQGLQTLATSSISLGPHDLPLSHAILRVKDQFGGTSRMLEKDLHGPPELIAEVAACSTAYGLSVKKDCYARHGVQEYLVWIVQERKFAWWTLESGEYVPLEQEHDGVIKSLVFPGLWLDTREMLADDSRKRFATLQNGLASQEYREFVKSLAARERGKQTS